MLKAYKRYKYNRYMNSYTWKLKRANRLAIDNYECQKCGSKKNLHVHHKTYKRFGNEKMKDLATVCQKCHAKIHKGGRLKEFLDNAKAAFVALFLMSAFIFALILIHSLVFGEFN